MDIDTRRKRQLFYLCCAIFIPVFGGFSVVNLVEGEWLEVAVNLGLLGLMGATLTAVLVLGRDLLIYRVCLYAIAVTSLLGVAIGQGQETILYWVMLIPPVLFFFLEKREGTWVLLGYAPPLSVLLLAGGALGTHPYELAIAVRFGLVYVLIVFLSYGLETARHDAATVVRAQNLALEQERERLEKALTEVKTLSGLLPICAGCKSVRSDTGYWEQIEAYLGRHSETRFSHGLCPDCARELYPDIPLDDVYAAERPPED